MSNNTWQARPTKRLPDQFGAPSNADVARVPDLPRRRTSDAATAAMPILADAVWRIDALDHQRDGAPSKIVRNLGTAGSILNARTGSTSVADTNDPRFLASEQSAYVYLPGANNNFLSVPDANNLDITGDLDVIVCADLETYTVINGTLASKYESATGKRSWWFRTNSLGRFELLWSADGNTPISASSTVAISGRPTWFRFTLDVDNGAGAYEVKFFTGTDGVTWTQLGTTVTGGATTSIFASTTDVQIGAAVSANTTAGNFYRTIIKNGIDGTTVLDVDTSVLTTGSATSFQAATGQTVTINRSTSGRKTVCVVSYPVWLFGTDDYMEVPLSATGSKLLDFGPNDSFTAFAAFRSWGTVPTQGNNIITKRNARTSVAGAGWIVVQQPTPQILALWWDRYQRSFAGQTTAAAGTTQIGIALRDRIRKVVQANSNTSSGTANDITGDITSTVPTLIGRLSAPASDYADMELMSAAIFRRALTSAEISTLTTYYQNRVA